jgi:teichoic acid transport system ATP-binding protein
MREKVIEIKDIVKTYKLYNKPVDFAKEVLTFGRKSYHRPHNALNGINLDVYKGECIGIIGTNGSGKSTLLKLVTGVATPTSGTIRVNGKISALLELGAGFKPEFTGLENIYLNGTILGYTEKEMDERVQSIIDFAEIGDFINQPVKSYSSGMFARLAFAVAINVDPDILIVDEALSVGDIFFQSKCYQKFMSFKEAGKTILFVSHDLGSVIKYCDRTLLIHEGNQIMVGESADVVNVYKKILVNQYDDGTKKEGAAEQKTSIANLDPNTLWKNSMVSNPKALEYGNGVANIIDYAIVDDQGNVGSSIYKGKEFEVRMKVEFYQPTDNPIFAYTIKDIKGNEVSGTNTMLEGKTPDHVDAGEIITVSFKQKMCLQGGGYLLALGCTGYVGGEFTVYSRLYDVCNIQVVSDKDTIGFVDMDAQIEYL